jgi:hypothetical protein
MYVFKTRNKEQGTRNKTMSPKPNHGHLGRKQKAVINDLLNGVNKYESLEKNRISPSRYRLWLKNKLFRQELLARFDSQKRQGKFVMARCIPHAAEILAKLIDSDKPETARKACSEIIALHTQNAEEQTETEKMSNQPKISDEKAARMLAILAEPEKPVTASPIPHS